MKASQTCTGLSLLVLKKQQVLGSAEFIKGYQAISYIVSPSLTDITGERLPQQLQFEHDISLSSDTSNKRM